MIAYLRGNVLAVTTESVIIENNGVGYEVFCSGAAFSAVQNTRREVELYTYLQVKEDGFTLYGFVSLSEKQVFLDLISVSGVGPKAAIAILSILSPEKLALAICAEDAKAISKANGVGAKTAARVILELHDKFMKETPSEILSGKASATAPLSSAGKGVLSEAQDALTVLGYTRAEAASALSGVDPTIGLENMIKQALKKLMR